MTVWHVTGAVEEYARAAASFLEADPCSRNVLRWIIELARRGTGGWSAPPTFFWLGDATTASAAACWTPPFNLHVSALPQDAVRPLVVLVHERRSVVGEPVAGVLGPTGASRAVADAWERMSGESAVLAVAEMLYELTSVREVPHPGGAPRRAHESDVPLLTAWLHAFVAEAHVPIGADPATHVVNRVRSGTMSVWEFDGQVVSMAGCHEPIVGVARVGPVYTPPELRGRGYARALVAHVSADALNARGATHCMLYADEANPVSNSIYRQIGYVPREQHADIRFIAADATGVADGGGDAPR